VSDCTGCQSLSNTTHQGTREMCRIVQDVRACLIRHTKGPGKCVRLYRMSEYSDFILVNRNTLGPYIFVGCHMMSENSGVGLRKFHCILLVHIRVSSLHTTGAHLCFITVYYWCTFVFHHSSLYTTGAHSCFFTVYYWCTFVFRHCILVVHIRVSSFITVYYCCTFVFIICIHSRILMSNMFSLSRDIRVV
jgi:hypothetical protein